MFYEIPIEKLVLAGLHFLDDYLNKNMFGFRDNKKLQEYKAKQKVEALLNKETQEKREKRKEAEEVTYRIVSGYIKEAKIVEGYIQKYEYKMVKRFCIMYNTLPIADFSTFEEAKDYLEKLLLEGEVLYEIII